MLVRQALLARREDCAFFGRTLTLAPQVALFVTFNPSYRGRSELPENMKMLLRPIAMVVPSYLQIAEILFYAEGFEAAQNLAVKTTTLYRLCSEQVCICICIYIYIYYFPF
jgi:dynein heavy chain